MCSAVEDFKMVVQKVLENEELNKQQHEGLYNFMQRCDVFAILPTGFGKSLIFQLVPAICKELKALGYDFPEKAVVVVVAWPERREEALAPRVGGV